MGFVAWIRGLFRGSPPPSIEPSDAWPPTIPDSREQGDSVAQPTFFPASEIVWDQLYNPPLPKRIEYADRHGEYSQRDVLLSRSGIGPNGKPYLGIIEDSVFKTLRTDRVLTCVDRPQTPTIRRMPRVRLLDLPLPEWHAAPSIFKIPSIAGNRRWTVDLSAYSCTCPERRVRASRFAPRTLGMACPHMVRAILENLPADAKWPEEVMRYLHQPDAGSTTLLL